MAETTEILWCDSTFNPWIGCTKVSPGCANCYAERDFDHRKHVAKWGPGQPRHRTSEAYWRQPLKWDRKAEADLAYWQEKRDRWLASGQDRHGPGRQWLATHDAAKPRRPRVFCGSLCDIFDPEVPIEWLADVLDLTRRCQNIDWLYLTKRPERAMLRLVGAGMSVAQMRPDLERWIVTWINGTPPANIWIGTTVEDQQRADERIPALLKIPARVRFLSCEPLLGLVHLRKAAKGMAHIEGNVMLDGIHWVICGGESGPHARPMHPDWARILRDQCSAADVPFMFKQHGEWLPLDHCSYWMGGGVDGPESVGVAGMRIRSRGLHGAIYPDRIGDPSYARVGKHAAGRLLDGHEHNEFPEVKP